MAYINGKEVLFSSNVITRNELKIINSVEINISTDYVCINKDADGKPFELTEAYILIKSARNPLTLVIG